MRDRKTESCRAADRKEREAERLTYGRREIDKHTDKQADRHT